MSNVTYYEQWLKIKEQMQIAILEDERLQELASAFVGIKPQGTAVEIVARVYCKFCDLYNKLCECYDQMEQVQRRPFIKKIIDALTCRILELKTTLEEVELFEFTYPDNALQQLLMVPQDIRILCPFHYPYEIRQKEMQYIIDQIFAGNRIGDPTPTASEIERREQERLEEEERIRLEKEAEMKRKLAMGEEIVLSDSESLHLSPEELEELKLQQEYNEHILNIQRMERSKYTIRERTHTFNKDRDLYLELAGLKAPQASEELRTRAASFIQKIYRRFMELKREHVTMNMQKEKLDMIIPSWVPPSAKEKLKKVKETRREFRNKYYENWLAENLKENSRVVRLREGDVMEDISAEIRQWFREWYDEVRLFDEFPFPEEGGSILIVTGETFTIEEYIEWRTEEEKRLKSEGAQKSKEQIKAEKLAAREEEKRLKLEAKLKEEKRLLDYKKARLNPDNDPGIYITIGTNISQVHEAWDKYQNQWKDTDTRDPPLDVIRGYISKLITENAYQDLQLKLRPVVDELMRLELNMLKNSLKLDYQAAGIAKPPQSKKRNKPKKIKVSKPDKVPPAAMFQALVDEGIIRKYEHITLDDYWGDTNYAAADTRAVLWTPSFPPACLGDVKEQVRLRCLLTLGSSCPNAVRSQLLVGPKGSGKKTLIYAIATETNSILIDLSPMNVYDKFPGPKNLKTMFAYVNRISRLMQPTIIFVDNADKIFCKKVPKEEKMFDPKRLQRDFFKEIIKPLIPSEDKILILGTATEPWLAKNGQMYKVFPSLILLPRTDYGSISYILTKILMKYHGMNREFNVHCVAQVLRGYDINSIRKAIDKLMNGKRVAELYYKPLKPEEIINAVLDFEDVVYTGEADYDMYKEWYESYSPWGKKYLDYMQMLESQLAYKLKADKKKK
ncbi:dynein regulatory complex protein 11-like [Vanessa tameamea]|uniref:Dynein regulatory complex protein 11-like n=1 Tax=Vanessa tameamea TaxID=334116 RepID=A0A8B8I003_VANTA|nr:dynein regulatory complex protein 11-like [Vanessa tameamea]